MSVNKDSQKAPNLRFKGFTDDWEQRKWSETVDISTEMVNPKTGEYDSLPHIGPGNIESFTGRILDNVKSVKEDNLISGKFHFYPGDVIYGKINPQLGKYAMVDFEGLASADSYVLNTKNGVSQTFLFTILQGTSFYKYSVSVSMRTGMPKINRDELNQYSYSAPSVVEQEKIGHFFKQLDDTIALHQRKLDQLNQLKEALLQQMFPGKGETVPKLRFAGFEGDWEERKLGEISEMYQPQTITGQDLTNSGYPVFGANGYIGYFSKYNHKSNQVTISARGEGTGTPSYVNGPVWITGNSMVINVDKNGIDKMFLYTNLLSFSLKKYVTGGAQPQLVREVLTNVPIKIPSNEEQNKLGYFFGQLNTNIINTKQKISNLQSLKQVLLQNMFI